MLKIRQIHCDKQCLRMRKILLYFFLFIYTIGVFKPYVPYFTDAVAHVLFFKDHIETVHSHKGKSHVHAEVNQLVKNEQSEKGGNNSKKVSFENDHIFYTTFQYLAPQISIDWVLSLPVFTKNNFADINLPPPKV